MDQLLDNGIMNPIFKIIFSGMLIFPWQAHSTPTAEEGFFSGRISKINLKASLVRIKVNFDNVKYLNAKDKIEFWDEKNSTLKCKSYVVARTADNLLLKIPEIEDCERKLYFITGAYFKFYSEDLLNNINMGREVVSILLKKRMAIQGQLDTKYIELQGHTEKLDAVNARYQLIRQKLEQEWQKEIQALDADKAYSLAALKNLDRQKDEVEQKLELYKLRDENLTLDRWSLDSNLYFKK